jgi:hypothetical protein
MLASLRLVMISKVGSQWILADKTGERMSYQSLVFQQTFHFRYVPVLRHGEHSLTCLVSEDPL